MIYIDSKPRIVRYCLCVLLLLSACKGGGPSQVPLQAPEASQVQREKTGADMLLLADTSLVLSEQHRWRIKAAEYYLQHQKQSQALAILEEIASHELDPENLGLYTRLYGQWALDQKLYPLAGSLLTDPRLAHITGNLESAQAKELMKLRADYFEVSWQYEKALEERLSLSLVLLDKTETDNNNKAIWRIINLLPEPEFRASSSSTTKDHSLLQAWLELAAITRSQSIDIQPQLNALEEWKLRWAGHPAASTLPAEVRYLETLASQRPRQITLLLPQSGPLASAGQAVINGILAAYYEAGNDTTSRPVVSIVDSDSNPDFLTLYQSVASSGTDFIIGPLDKNRVNQLASLETLSVPTLALNYAENPVLAPAGLLQFGLNPEDDVAQALDYALVQGYQKAMILVPESEWGERLANTLVDGWQKQEGTVSGIAYFDGQKGNFSSVISNVLGIDESTKRMSQIRRIIGETLEFEPRRRQDIDVILLSARPEDARQIKPMLAFHYAHDLPILATSNIYNGYDDPIKDNDLNGILFTAIPWFSEDTAVKRSIDKSLGEKSNFQSLYALGVDAYRLHLRSGLLSSSSNSQINGSSGVLRLSQNAGRIQRQQRWMKMISGKARPQISDSRPLRN
ncbi:MAG: penicillin-binding protein activator [Pseudomonadales bacterium]|nr:penicillin-binding protein activator [Pseudomonadales bacterium]